MTNSIFLGYDIKKSSQKSIFLDDSDRIKNCHIIGQTGSGKTTLMKNMAIQDIQNGKWVCVIDPFGDLVQNIFEKIPENRKNDVIYVDLMNPDLWFGINIFEYFSKNPKEQEEERNKLIFELTNIFIEKEDLERFWSLCQEILKNGILTLWESENIFLDFLKLFSDENFRNNVLEKIQNPSIQDFWKKYNNEIEWYTPLLKIQVLDFFDKKFKKLSQGNIGKFLNYTNSLNFEKVISEKKILLCSLVVRDFDHFTKQFLGRLLAHKLDIATDLHTKNEKISDDLFCIYMDEFQIYHNCQGCKRMLERSSQRWISVTIAHQFLLQLCEDWDKNILEDDFGKNIFENTQTKIVFKLWGQDANFMSQFLLPIEAHEIQVLPHFEAFVQKPIKNKITQMASKNFKNISKPIHIAIEEKRW